MINTMGKELPKIYYIIIIYHEDGFRSIYLHKAIKYICKIIIFLISYNMKAGK